MKTTPLMTGIAAFLLSGGIAVASPGGMFGLDADDDGNITRAELSAKLDERFSRMDSNGDGQITETEMDSARERLRDEVFTRLDANGDGSVSRAEMEAAAAMRTAGRKGRSNHLRAAILSRMDTNGDGAITKTELEARALERFEKLDANGDGTITEQERVEHRGKRK